MRRLALAVGFFIGAAPAVWGQAIASGGSRGGDAALTYSYIHSNTQPGQCGCFSITGLDLSASRSILNERTAAVLDINASTAKNGPGTGNSLTLVSYTAGARYYPYQPWIRHVQPFGQLLVGIAHAGGGIAGAGDGTYALAGRLGVPLNNKLSIRLLQAEYYLTNFPNASNSHQNNYLIGAGAVLRFSRGN